jgi:hypothetical protein
LQPDGRWLIRTNGGIVVLSPDGRLAMARCARQAK